MHRASAAKPVFSLFGERRAASTLVPGWPSLDGFRVVGGPGPELASLMCRPAMTMNLATMVTSMRTRWRRLSRPHLAVSLIRQHAAAQRRARGAAFFFSPPRARGLGRRLRSRESLARGKATRWNQEEIVLAWPRVVSTRRKHVASPWRWDGPHRPVRHRPRVRHGRRSGQANSTALQQARRVYFCSAGCRASSSGTCAVLKAGRRLGGSPGGNRYGGIHGDSGFRQECIRHVAQVKQYGLVGEPL